MSKDIRSFFSVKSRAKEKPAKKVELSDDDVIPESPDVQIKSKKKESRKKRVIDDSSDEEIFNTKKPKPSEEENKSSAKAKGKKTEKANLKEVKVVDLFGNGPIKRTEPIVKKDKKEPKTEIGIHDDDDFEKSLLELDNVEDHVNEDTIKPAESNNHEMSKYSDGSPPSKSPDTEDKNDSDVKQIKADDTISDHKKLEKEPKHKKHDKLSKHEKVEPDPIIIDDEDSKEKTENKSKPKTPSKREIKQKATDTKTEKDFKDKSNEKKTKLEHYKIPKSHSDEHKHTDRDRKYADNGISRSKSSGHSSKAAKSEKKRDFSEFLSGDEEQRNYDEERESKNKKKKLDASLNNSVLSDEERHERKRYSAALYQNYLNRSGPKNLGSKELPEGSPSCLKDCAFLLTGVLQSFEREEIAEAITKYGGTVKSGISKKVTHVLAGDDAGPAKLAKAEDLGIKIINEDDFLKMTVDLSKKDVTKEKSKDEKKIKEKSTNKTESKENGESSKKKNKVVSADKMKSFEEKIKKNFYAKAKESPIRIDSSPERDSQTNNIEQESEVKLLETAEPSCSASTSDLNDAKKDLATPSPAANSLMWVEKYKPQNVKQIIGQHGDASNVKKLMNWLTKWYVSRKEKLPKPSPWSKNNDGAYYKAALLSGPPGIGKTTTVSLVCKELGFDLVEFNASDTRSKNLIKTQIGELLTTTSLSGYAKGESGKKAITKKHVLVMDEVDGMAGNEDRGGLQELISLIKTAAVPVICMCNDRNSEKMRTLVNYCYDLKFTRPRVDQIKSAMLSVCFKEGVKIPVDALTQLIVASNHDVRQTLNALSMWAIDPSMLDNDKLKVDANSKKKDLKMGQWEAVRKVFSEEDHKSMSLIDKSDLFFYDYSMAPLFVQENYINVQPHCPKNEVLDRLSKAADSISVGDLVDARIRRSQAWNLLPMQAMYSSVIPGTVLSGHVAAQVQFPGWLGNNSRANKMHRLAQEIHSHTRLSTTGSKSSIYLDYARHLRDAIVTPLVRDKMDGISTAVQVLRDYHLLREDLDSLTELATWPGQRDPMLMVDSKIKAAMTRTYNKQAPALPHAAASFSKGRKKRTDDDGATEMEDDDVGEDSEPENDAMIKVKKKAAPKAKETEKPSTSTSKGEKGKKGKGKK